MTQSEIDMSSEGITRLMQVEQLRRLCLALSSDEQSAAEPGSADPQADERTNDTSADR